MERMMGNVLIFPSIMRLSTCIIPHFAWESSNVFIEHFDVKVNVLSNNLYNSRL